MRRLGAVSDELTGAGDDEDEPIIRVTASAEGYKAASREDEEAGAAGGANAAAAAGAGAGSGRDRGISGKHEQQQEGE